MAFDRSTLRGLKKFRMYRYLAIPRRALFGGGYVFSGVPQWVKWIFTSREESNFTYDLTEDSLLYLAHALAAATGHSIGEARAAIDELRADDELARHVISRTQESEFRSVSDKRVGYGRRLGWYALVRLTKPAVVVETGVDKGLGAVVLCAALLRNREEGHEGRYYGTDIVPTAGWLLSGKYAEMGKILYGDSIESLAALDERIDIFINDSDHSADYELREYETVLAKMAPSGLMLADNAHVTAKLAEFSRDHGRRFVFFGETPENHWYPGGGIGISYQRP